MTDDIYISAKKLKAHYAWWGDTEERKTLDAIVDAQPAADVEEVRHGMWVEVEGEGYDICSECGNSNLIGHLSIEFDYCPYCGAKMDKEKEE